MDLNNDGYRDMITGHYWPGDIFVFWGNSDGEYAAMKNLKDDTGRNLNAGDEWKSENEPNLQSLAAAPYATDWDGDGDFDMLIGNISGQVVLMENIGDTTKPEFSTKRILLKAGGKEIKVADGDSGPVHADWNQDGVRDLIVGAGDGSVMWFKNEGSELEPKFADGKTLIGPSENDSFPFQSAPIRPGIRVKVCVTDYNGDGLVDLLVGDFISEEAQDRVLSEKETARRDELKEQIDDFGSKMSAEYMDFQAEVKELEKDSAPYKTAEENYKTMVESFNMDDIYSEYQSFVSDGTYHGFVWLYLRQANGQASRKMSGKQMSGKQLSGKQLSATESP